MTTEDHVQAETDKLFQWADEAKLALERELKLLDAQIKAARARARSAVMLSEKLEAQKFVRTLQEQRRENLLGLFDAQDAIDRKLERRIEELAHRTERNRE